MKKTILCVLTLGFMSVGNAFAQKTIDGDMNHDGRLTVEDVSLLVQAILEDKDPAEHDYVNLGLPSNTLWATCNIGANKPEDRGYYFAWGETETKDTYTWATYFDSNDGENFTTYKRGGKLSLLPEHDAAYQNWGEEWQMPSSTQMEELINKCTWTWDESRFGYVVTGTNGNSIFMPVTSRRDDASNFDSSNYGYYLTRTLNEWTPTTAWILSFNPSNGDPRSTVGDRYAGRAVRPVRR